MADIIFQPVRGTQAAINRMPIREGFIYFAYDSGRIYLDKDGDRILMSNVSGSGVGSSGIIYANGTSEGETPNIIAVDPEDEENKEFRILSSAFENETLPSLNNLILNADGRFFRVLAVNETLNEVTASLLAVSGSGNSGPVVPVDPDVRINLGDNSYDYMSFIYGQETYLEFTPEADRDNYVSLRFVVKNADQETLYEKLF